MGLEVFRGEFDVDYSDALLRVGMSAAGFREEC